MLVCVQLYEGQLSNSQQMLHSPQSTVDLLLSACEFPGARRDGRSHVTHGKLGTHNAPIVITATAAFVVTVTVVMATTGDTHMRALVFLFLSVVLLA